MAKQPYIPIKITLSADSPAIITPPAHFIPNTPHPPIVTHDVDNVDGAGTSFNQRPKSAAGGKERANDASITIYITFTNTHPTSTISFLKWQTPFDPLAMPMGIFVARPLPAPLHESLRKGEANKIGTEGGAIEEVEAKEKSEAVSADKKSTAPASVPDPVSALEPLKTLNLQPTRAIPANGIFESDDGQQVITLKVGESVEKTVVLEAPEYEGVERGRRYLVGLSGMWHGVWIWGEMDLEGLGKGKAEEEGVLRELSLEAGGGVLRGFFEIEGIEVVAV